MRKHLPCLGTPPPPFIAHTIAQYSIPPLPSCIAIHAIQYWSCQYCVKAKYHRLMTPPRGDVSGVPRRTEKSIKLPVVSKRINIHQCIYMYVYADICRYIDIYHLPSLDDTSEGECQRRLTQNRKVDKASSYIVLYINIHQCTYTYVYVDMCRETY